MDCCLLYDVLFEEIIQNFYFHPVTQGNNGPGDGTSIFVDQSQSHLLSYFAEQRI